MTLVRVVTRRGTVEAPARVVDTIRPDTLFVPFHWAGAARANSATIDALDPTSRMPEFKVCAARLERVVMRAIVVVGYGMAGARLASELHARARTCDVTVLGAEPHRAYNRILLSNLVAGQGRPRPTCT